MRKIRRVTENKNPLHNLEVLIQRKQYINYNYYIRTIKILQHICQKNKGDYMKRKRKLTDFGKRVRKILIDKNMSQRELAKVIGTSESYLCDILCGAKNDRIYSGRIRQILGIEESA